MKYDSNYNPVDELFGKNRNTNLDNQEANTATQNNSTILNTLNNNVQNNNVDSSFNNLEYNNSPYISSVENNSVNLNEQLFNNGIEVNQNSNINISEMSSYESNNNNKKQKKFNKRKLFTIFGIILFLIILIVIGMFIFMTIKQKEEIKNEVSVLTDKIDIKAVGFDFNEPFDKNKYEYDLEIDTEKVQIKCNKRERVEGCNQVLDLANKDSYDHLIKYISLNGKEHLYTIHINKKQNNGPIKIDLVQIDNTDYSKDENKVVVNASSDNKGKLEYSFDGGNTWQDSNEYKTQNNEEVNIVVKDQDGNKTENKIVEIDNIDKTKPIVDITIKEQTKDKIVLYANAKDDLSEIEGYSWNDGAYTKSATYEVTKAGTYTVIVKDSAGNVSSKASINIPESSFNKEVKKEQKKYIVKLISNGASIDKNEVSCTTYDISCKVVLPNIIKENSIIIGWAEEKDSKEAKYKTLEEITITSNKTLYAITAKKLTATFVSNGAEITGSQTRSCNIYNNETTCTIKTPVITRNGWNILGFDESSNSKTAKYKTSSNITLSSNVTLYAITSKKVEVNFESNGSKLNGETKYTCNLYNKNSTCAITTPEIVRNGWQILGYAKTKDAKDAIYKSSSSISLSSNITLYAITSKKIEVNFESNGATLNGETKYTCNLYNEKSTCTVKAPTIVRAGWQILGFAETKDSKTVKYKSSETISLTSNKTLYAITKKTNTATFNGNGAKLSVASLKCDMYNAQTSCNIKTPTITRSGWQILGFAETKDSKIAKYKSSETISLTSNKTLYAITTKQLTATFSKNGATSLSSNFDMCYLYNTETSCSVKAPTITRNGWDVLGFSTNKSATSATIKPVSNIVLTSNKTLYAITKKTVTINFEVNSKNALGYKEFDYIEYSSKSCDMYNTQSSCKIKMPFVDIKGLMSFGFDEKQYSNIHSEKVSYKIGTSYNFSENKILYASFETHAYFRDIRNNVADRIEYKTSSGTIFIDIEKGCNVNTYKSYFNDIYNNSDWKFLLNGNSKIMILTRNTMKTAHKNIGNEENVIAGSAYGENIKHVNVSINCTNASFFTIVHELSHRWNYRYQDKYGTSLKSRFETLYNKYKVSSIRPVRDYGFSNLSEFFAVVSDEYYMNYVDNNKHVISSDMKKGKYTQDLKTLFEQTLSQCKV